MRWLSLVWLCLCSYGVSASALVSTSWLEANLQNPKVKVIEVSVDPTLYAMSHIPSAQMLNWQLDLTNPITRDIASRQALQQKLQALGIRAGDTVVLYGDHHNWFAAWGYWLLHGYGLEQLKLLDGGRVKWESEGLPLSRTPARAEPGNVQLRPFDNLLRARLSDVLEVVEQGQTGQLVDIRSPAEYQGEISAPEGSFESAQRAGHIPGAINIPWQQVLNADGTFKTVEALKVLYQSRGIDGQAPIITYCRIGERSSHSWFVLSQLLGYEARNYDGSWTEYGNSVGLPISNPSYWQ